MLQLIGPIKLIVYFSLKTTEHHAGRLSKKGVKAEGTKRYINIMGGIDESRMA